MIAISSAGALRTTTRTVLASVSSFVHKGLDLDTAQTVLSRAPDSTDLGDFFSSLPASVSLAKKGLDLETAQAKLTHVLASHVQTLKDEQNLMLEHKGEVDEDDDSGYKGAHIGVQGSSNTIALGHHAEASSHTSIVLGHDKCDCCGHVDCGCCRQISEGSYGDEAAITTAVLIFPTPLPTLPGWHPAVCSTVRPNSSKPPSLFIARVLMAGSSAACQNRSSCPGLWQ